MNKIPIAGGPALRELRITVPPLFYRCEPAWSWSPPPLSDFDLWCVEDGEGTMNLNGRSQRFGAGRCFLFQPGAELKASHNPRRRLRVFAVHFNLLDKRGKNLPSARIDTGGILKHCPDPAFFFMMGRRCEELYRTGESAARRAAEMLVEQMLLHLTLRAEAPGPSDYRVSKVVVAVREEPGRDWSVAGLARLAGLSRSQLTRRFIAIMNLSPERFIILTRVERARQLLRETELAVGQIALSLGYNDIYYFSRQFRQVTGHTAREERDARKL